MSYVYIRSESDLWTVGFYDPQGKWHAESDYGSSKAASERVHWLNGVAGSDIIDEECRSERLSEPGR